MSLKRAVVFIFVLGLVQAFALPGYAQTVLNFPRVISNSSLFTGLAVGNPTASSASVTFTAFLPDGTPFAPAGGQNPATLQIPAGGQAAKVFSDIFGSGDFNGWIQATSSTTGLTGFFLNGNTSLTDLDGAGVITPAAQFSLPFASEDSVAQTEITVVNVNANAATPALTLYGLDGSVIATKVLSVPSRSLVRQTLTGIFGSLDFSSASHVDVSSDLPVIGHEVVANYALAGSTVRRETAALSGQPATAATTYILPQFATGGGWLSLIGIVNASGLGQEITLTAHQDDGTVANVPNNPVKISLDGNAALRTTADQLFGFSSDSLVTGWIQIEASVGYVSSYIGYGNNASPSFAAVAGTDASSGSQFEVFSQVAQGDGFYTGLSLVNPGTQAADVQFYTIRPDGTTVGQASFTVQPNQRVGNLFSQILPASLSQVGGWAFLRSSQPVVGAVLFGTINGDALANVPQQIPDGDFTPAPQTTAAIDGNVQAGGQPIGNVQVSLSGPVVATTTTDSSGNYIFPQLPAGSYVVTAVQSGAQFVPAQQAVNLAQQNADGVNFQAAGLTAAGAPSIQFVSPTATFAGNDALNIRVFGSNFTPESVIQLNGQALATVFVSSVEVDGIIPAAQFTAAGTLQLTVQTAPPGGGVSSPVPFTVNTIPSSPLIIQPSVQVGSSPTGVAIDTARNTALVTNQSGNNVTFLNLATFATKATISVGRSPADGIAILPSENLALVANPGSNTVSVIDLTTNTNTQDITVGSFPVGLAINPTTNQAVVTNANDDNVSVIDLNTLTVIGQIGVGTIPEGVAINPTTNQAVVTNSGGDDAWIIDLASRTILAKIPVGHFPRGVAISSTTNVAVVVNADSNTVTVIDLAHQTAFPAITVGTGPTDVAIHELTNLALVTNSGVASGSTNFGVAGSVSVVDLGALTTLPGIPVASSPFGIAVDQGNQQAVVANFGTGSVTVIRVPNPIPHISTVSPTTFPAGGGDFTITITGTGFVPTSVVTLNGQSLPTTYVSSTQLQADVPSSVQQQVLQVQSSSSVANVTTNQLADTTPFTLTIGVSNPGPGGGSAPPSPNSNNTHLTPQNLRPVLTSISPLQTSAGSGPLTLTLNGNNFNATSIISFGGSLFSPSSSSGTSMTVIVPANVLQPGMYPVSITNPPPGGGVSSNVILFTVNSQSNPAPSVSSVSPATIPAGSGPATVTVQGSNFIGSAVATLGSAHGTVSGNTVTFSLSANDTANPGTLAGLITNPAPAGGSATFSVSILNVSPTVSGFTPTTANAGSSALPIQVSGTNFRTGTVITVEGTPVTPTQVVSSTQLNATIPASFLERSGNLHIGAMNPPPGGGSADGGVLTVISAVPTLSGANPATATVRSTDLTIQLIGTGFAGNSEAMIGSTQLTSVFNSTTSLNVTIPASFLSKTGTLQIVVTNPPPGGGTSAALNYAVQNPVPVLTSVSPTSLSGNQTNAVLTLTGQSFVTGATVSVGGQSYTPTAISFTQITVPLSPPLPLGNVPVTVTNPVPGGGVSNAVSIDIFALMPTITATSPSVVSTGGTLLVTGTNFGPGSTALINDQPVPTVVNSTTTLDAMVPATLSAGTASLTIRNPVPSGTPLVSPSVTITIGNPVPSISSLSPATAYLNQSNQQITIQGQGFSPASQVQAAGSAVTSSFVNPGTLTFTLPNLSSGTFAQIQVMNPPPGGGTATATLQLIASAPTVSGISPASGTAFTTVGFVVAGSNFVNGAKINFGGTPISTEYLGTTELGGTVTLGSAGTVSVSVTNPGGATSNSATFTITAPVVGPNPAPSISSLSPSSVTAGSETFLMTILGSNFISGSSVMFGSTPLSVTAQTSTSLMVSVPGSALTTPGNIIVTVLNPGPGGGSATSSFNVRSQTGSGPTTLTLSPSLVLVAFGGNTTVTVSVDVAPSAPLTVGLTFGGTNGSFSSDVSRVTNIVTIASGMTSASIQIFGYSTGTTTLTASANGLTSATISVNVLAALADSLSVSPSAVALAVAITRPASTIGAPPTIGLSAAPGASLSVPFRLTFPANAQTITTNIAALASGNRRKYWCS